jgi:predicted O-methyltransferase YrrM
MPEDAQDSHDAHDPHDLQDQWTAVDTYLSESLSLSDPALEAALAANAAGGLPSIDVSPSQGKFLQLLAQLRGARRILEIGTLGGYSTICMARALPEGGRVVTLEVNAKHAEVARANIARAGLAEVVEIRVGPALETLARMQEEGTEPFDMIFIDADKPNNPAYLGWALKLSRRGSLILCDNVVRDGAVADAESTDPAVQGARGLFERLGAEPRLSATALQTVGLKGYDGFAMALVVGD